MMAEFAARVSQGHIGRARYLATNDTARSNRKIIMQLPLKLGSLAAAYQAAQTLIDLATGEAKKNSEEQDEYEKEKLQQAYGKVANSRGMATGGAKAVKELEKEQKSRSTRVMRDSIDFALVNLASFYRDVLMVQLGNTEAITNKDMCEEIETYASAHSEYSTILKFGALMDARTNLELNVVPLVNCEALMCRLAIS